MIKRLLIGAACALGLGGFFGASKSASNSPHRVSEVKASLNHNPQTGAVQSAEIGGSGPRYLTGYGRTPYEFGISRECARMRRKNQMRSKGIAGSRI